MSALSVEFCGEQYLVDVGEVLSVGRNATLVVDEDNPYLHRRLVEFRHDRGFWWLENVGSRLSVTVSGGAGSLQSFVGPGSCLPLVLPEVTVLFAAGDTTYEIWVRCPEASFTVTRLGPVLEGHETLGSVALTHSQLRLLLALSEATLRRAGTGTSEVPSNADAARRLGWSITTFNRKLDNVCEKYSRAGVKGLRGDARRLATNRRVRLVEYAVAARIVTFGQLSLLDEPDEGAKRA